MVAQRGLAGLSAGASLVLLIFCPSAHQVLGLGPVLGHQLALRREGAGRCPEMARSTHLGEAPAETALEGKAWARATTKLGSHDMQSTANLPVNG